MNGNFGYKLQNIKTMKKTFYFVLGLLILNSCQYQVDNSNAIKTAEALYEGLSRNDSTILKQVFAMDSLDDNSIENLNKAKIYFKKNEDIELLKIDTIKIANTIALEIYFKKDKVFLNATSFYLHNSTKTIKLDDFYFQNMNEECEEDKNTPYKPSSSVDFRSLTWGVINRGKRLKYGLVELQNNTDSIINFIKFRVILRKNSQWNSEVFFNQTITSHKPIHKGDIVRIDVPGMTDYYTGFKIEKDKLFFDIELIEVKPKPDPLSCRNLRKLKNEVIKNPN